jgi:hypothetical protein
VDDEDDDDDIVFMTDYGNHRIVACKQGDNKNYVIAASRACTKWITPIAFAHMFSPITKEVVCLSATVGINE